MLILRNIYLAPSMETGDLSIEDGKISFDSNWSGRQQVVFDGAVVFPGLINSHDHLDFNLFPQLGHEVYKSYKEWGSHIHNNYKAEIEAVIRVPKSLRTAWGIYKNLLCGVTTVVNHGDMLALKAPLINVLQSAQSIHSVGFDKRWKLKLNNPLQRKKTAVVHAGEGVDEKARKEIDQLTCWNLLRRKMVAVHGVSMLPQQAAKFRALVWCPESNLFLLKATAPVNQLKRYVHILFGTDSTLTGRWDIWQHIRQARQTGMLTDDELWDSLTSTPASIWQRNAGIIAPGYDADLVVAKTEQGYRLNTLLDIGPEDILLVLHGGYIRLFDEVLYHQLKDGLQENFSKIRLGNSIKYIAGDLQGLMNQIKHYYPAAQFPVSAA